MKTFINGIEISEHRGHFRKWLVYIDNKLASDGKELRPKLNYDFWIKFIQKHPYFNPKCVLPIEAPWNTNPTFEDLYPEIDRRG